MRYQRFMPLWCWRTKVGTFEGGLALVEAYCEATRPETPRRCLEVLLNGLLLGAELEEVSSHDHGFEAAWHSFGACGPAAKHSRHSQASLVSPSKKDGFGVVCAGASWAMTRRPIPTRATIQLRLFHEFMGSPPYGLGTCSRRHELTATSGSL